MKPARIRSGAQTGADIGALRAAATCGIPTAGYVPRNCKTEQGDMPWLIGRYGLTETPTRGYQTRTIQNVVAADLTVLYGDLTSPGSLATLRAVRGKPWGQNLSPADLDALVTAVTAQLGRPIDLNIAGNRESGNPGIEAWVYATVTGAWLEDRPMNALGEGFMVRVRNVPRGEQERMR